MANKPHFEIPRSMAYKIITALFTVIICLGLYVYQGDEQATRASLKTNQQAIQATLDGMIANDKDIAVGKTRMDGHVVNPVAHTN